MIVKGKKLLPMAFALVAALFVAACGNTGGGGSSSTSVGGITAPAPPAVPFAEAKFAFAPVTGAPATVLTRLSAELGKEAYIQHVSLVPSGDTAATYVVKGYLSALGDTSGTILVYVWDIFDTSGRRVHRISGQETSAGGSQSDPWSGVDSSTTANVARRTISSIVAWGNAR